MIIQKNNTYESTYFNGLSALINQQYMIQGDKKVAYETNAVFQFNYLTDAILVKDNKFISQYDYDKIQFKGNERVINELSYYTKYILENGQLMKNIEKLSNKIYTKQAVLTLPKKDLYKFPCAMYIFCRVINNKLRVSTHMRANNAYGHALINMHIGNAISSYISRELNIECNEYFHFVDSYHIYKRDEEEINKFLFSYNHV